MDQLFKRYNDPFRLVDCYIKTCKFYDFVEDFIESYNKEVQWEYYLHKIWDKTWNEYEEGVKEEVKRIESSHMSEAEQENVIADSMSILQSFQPQE